MYKNKKILAVVPARGGSKGVSRKNIRMLGDKPLIAWTIKAAQRSKYIDHLILSSEDNEIIEIAKKWGCCVPFKRPMYLAKDDTSGVAPLLHAVEQVQGYDYIVLLQPTSPFRTEEDIDGCIEFCFSSNSSAVVSVTEPDKSPFWMYHIAEQTGVMTELIPHEQNIRRQDLPKVYVLNGAIYIACIDWLKKVRTFKDSATRAYIMPKYRSMDIDTELDLRICELMVTDLKSRKTNDF